ncbi:hypothetical protein Tco_0986783 [Tanacetum coccineum]
MNPGSTSNSQFLGFSSQAPMTPEQLAFLQSQQQAFFQFQQNQQQTPQQFSMPQQQSQSSNSLSQTEAQPKRVPRKRSTKKIQGVEIPDGGIPFRRQPNEETLLAKCYVVVSEDRNVGSELDVMKQARAAYRDENKNTTFAQEDAWELLRKHAKWDAPAPAPVDLTEDEEIAETSGPQQVLGA